MYSESREDFEGKVLPFIQHLERLNINIDEDKLVGYYKIQYEEIRSLWEQTQELAQLGIAVEIIDHQFNALYSQLANIIGMFKDSIKDNEKSQKLYKFLVSTFAHLQNNYKFLTPLYRTTGRTRKDISGREIKEYIEAFFSERLNSDNIQLTSTKEFDNSVVYTYESILKPVFINVVNNAVYWLASADKKIIHLTYEEESYLIMNSGQPIDEVYIKEDIFKLFFSRKPKGRGIGLYLAKTTLNSIGFDIIKMVGLVFGNIVVILIEGLLVFINTLRLHYYEFFFKFFQGSGLEYFPFYLDTDYSVIKFSKGMRKDIISEEIDKEIEVKSVKDEIDKAKNFISQEFK